jgi:hypothetical protein
LDFFVENYCGRDRMIVEFTTTCASTESLPIITKVVSLNPAHGKVYLIQQYVINFVSDLLQIGGIIAS